MVAADKDAVAVAAMEQANINRLHPALGLLLVPSKNAWV
jgi:hypothetical protein